MILPLNLEVLIIFHHSLGNDAMNQIAYFLGVRMCLAGTFMEAEVQDMFPLLEGIGISYHRIGIERKNAAGILRLHARFQQTAIEPVSYLASGKIEELLPAGAFMQPMRTGNLHTTFNFNSIKVRLEHTAQAVADKLFYDFNSIKVRLEQHEIYG